MLVIGSQLKYTLVEVQGPALTQYAGVRMKRWALLLGAVLSQTHAPMSFVNLEPGTRVDQAKH